MISEARGVLDTDKIQRLTDRVRDFIERSNIHEQSAIDPDTEQFITCTDFKSEFKCAGSLAYHGLLTSVRRTTLLNVDQGQIPAQHLASLASCVAYELDIYDDRSCCDLVSILPSLKRPALGFFTQTLGREETQAIVQAMQSNVAALILWDNVTLDIEALTEYSGHGVCRAVTLWGRTVARYREELATWARSRNWIVDDENADNKPGCIQMGVYRSRFPMAVRKDIRDPNWHP